IHDSIFFYQAEDGIRDFHVTGVQTCALPICFLSRMTEKPRKNSSTVAWPTRPCRRSFLTNRSGTPSVSPSGMSGRRRGPSGKFRSEERRVRKERRWWRETEEEKDKRR